jgi:RNA polymerase sigma-70 factor (ECF subfamily)
VDRILATLASEGAEAAAEMVLRERGPAVLRYLRSLLRDEDEADDAFSVFAQQVWKGIAAVRVKDAIDPWLFRIAFREAVRQRDDAWTRRKRTLPTSEADRVADEVRRSAASSERRLDALEKLRASLSLEEQHLLVLRIDHALPFEAIAETLGTVDAAAVRKRFQRIKARLARLAKSEGLVD